MDRAYPCLFCLEGLEAYAPYTGLVATLLGLFKAKKRRVLAKVLAPLFIPMLAPIEKPLLIPVPASRKGLATRGFDQMILISRILTRLTGDPSLHLFVQKGKGESKFLSRIERQGRHTITMRPLDRKVSRLQKEGYTFVLLDDIHTTGATLALCRKMLAERYGIQAFSLVLALV